MIRVSVGMRLQDGPWGGGNQFGRALSEFLKGKGVEVSFDLSSSPDIILLTEPRKELRSSAYTHDEIIRYLKKKRWDTLVVHRINECDERKKTKGVNRLVIQANRCADHTVFISQWLKDLFERNGLRRDQSSVIHNGADPVIFNSNGYRPWDRKGPLKLVTHHWGGHHMKGFDIYERLDNLLDSPKFRGRISFTYVGNVPQGFKFKLANQIPALYGQTLADMIRSHHVYLTASLNEPAGMHHIEGALCGLPLLYRESGALPEYCGGYGVSFTEKNFEEKLFEMMERYEDIMPKMRNYPYTSGRMCQAYYSLFLNLLDRKDEIIKSRSVSRKPTHLFSAGNKLKRFFFSRA